MLRSGTRLMITSSEPQTGMFGIVTFFSCQAHRLAGVFVYIIKAVVTHKHRYVFPPPFAVHAFVFNRAHYRGSFSALPLLVNTNKFPILPTYIPGMYRSRNTININITFFLLVVFPLVLVFLPSGNVCVWSALKLVQCFAYRVCPPLFRQN